jgi:hypothetical protein
MSSDKPGGGAIPGWGQQPQGEPAPASPAGAPAPGSGAIPGWGQQPVPPTASPAPEPPPDPGPAAPAPPVPIPQAPPSPSAQPTPGTAATPGWGPAATPPSAAPSGAQPGWGPATAPGAPGGAPPEAWNPAPVQASGSSGCLKLVLVLVVIAVIGFTLLVAAILFIGRQFTESIGVGPDGSVGTPCPFIDDSELSAALGSDAEAIVLDGLWDATVGIILDKRVLATAEDCWITADESTPTGRIAVYRGGDAAGVFRQEREHAAPTSVDQGNGITVTTDGWFAGEVGGIGDEAFCTGVSPAIQAGVLVRQGDRVVYVSLSGPADQAPQFETTDDGVIWAPAICATAQEVAREILD